MRREYQVKMPTKLLGLLLIVPFIATCMTHNVAIIIEIIIVEAFLVGLYLLFK
jgi:hypothetical protein